MDVRVSIPFDAFPVSSTEHENLKLEVKELFDQKDNVFLEDYTPADLSNQMPGIVV